MALWLLTILHYWVAIIAFTVVLALAAETSTTLFNLEMAIHRKGILSDGVPPPSSITKAVMWLFDL